MRPAVLLSALLGAVLLAGPTAAKEEVLSGNYTQTYTYLGGVAPCARLASSTGVVGCQGRQTPIVAPLVLLETGEDADDWIADAKAIGEPHALLLAHALLTAATVARLLATDNAAALLVLPAADLVTHSPAAKDAWNARGDAMSEMSYDVPIILLTDEDEAAALTAKASLWKSGDKRDVTHHPRYAVEVDAFMYTGPNDAATCLDQGRCWPLGGFSIVRPFPSVLLPDTETIVVASALDATGFFHDRAIGAESFLSGAVAAMAIAKAFETQVDPAVFGTAEQPQLIFGFFNGEQFGHLGSRRFLADIAGESFPEGPKTPSDYFKNVTLDDLSAVVELNQVGAQGTPAYAHPGTGALADALAAVGLQRAFAASDGSVMPPDSMAKSVFQSRLEDLPAVVVGTYNGTFTNGNYKSHLDLETHPVAICRTAQLVVDSGILLREGKAANVTVDCALVERLVQCLAVDFSCDFVDEVMGDEVDLANVQKQPSHYVGVFQESTVDLYRYFVAQLMNETKEAHWHIALSTGLKFDYEERKWVVVDESVPNWTESYWSTVSVRYFLQDSSVVGIGLLLVGVLSSVIAWIGAIGVRRFYALMHHDA